MELWLAWWNQVRQLRPAFKRTRTFLWFAVALAATCIRADLLGVTSMVRALGLRERCYDRLLDCLHSRAIDLDALTRRWVSLVLFTLKPFIYTVQGRIVLVADGIKVAKSGRKMPAVKKLHQESDNNSKPEFIFGHSCQAGALIVRAATSFLAIPLACRIHEGVVFSNRDHRSLLDKLVLMVNAIALTVPFYLVADTYYAAATIIRPLLTVGQHLITSVRSNAVAYEAAPPPTTIHKGRPRLYGGKIKLKTLFDDKTAFIEASSPIYGEKNVSLRYRLVELCIGNPPAALSASSWLSTRIAAGKSCCPPTDPWPPCKLSKSSASGSRSRSVSNRQSTLSAPMPTIFGCAPCRRVHDVPAINTSTTNRRAIATRFAGRSAPTMPTFNSG